MSTHILDVDISTLKVAKYKAMKEHIIGVLDKVKDLIEKGDYAGIDDITFISTSGDGWGDENSCINFAWRDGEYMDIGEATHRLMELDADKDIG